MEYKILLIESLNKEIKSNKTSLQRKVDLYRLRALLNLEIERFDNVISDCNKCLTYFDIFKEQEEINPDIKKIYNDEWISRILIIRGLAFFKKGNKKKVINDLTSAIQLNPKILKEKSYLIDKLPNDLKTTFKYLAEMN